MPAARGAVDEARSAAVRSLDRCRLPHRTGAPLGRSAPAVPMKAKARHLLTTAPVRVTRKEIQSMSANSGFRLRTRTLLGLGLAGAPLAFACSDTDKEKT